jgi:chloramphenicol O-acetyltransferase type A
VQFKHFSFHSYENKNYFFPTIEAGKFYDNNGKLLMPLSITVHHATTDGWHIINFLNDLQYEMDHPEIWIK